MIGRVNAGGGGSLQATDAILRVIAPAGSTVTISKGGVSKSDLGHENAADNTLYDYYFIIHASQFDSINPWTVTATLGSDTASDTVIIDSADEYDVTLSYLVPAAYQAVEYLQSSGTQYILTPVKWQSDIRVVTNFNQTSISVSYPKLFGSEASNTSGIYRLDIRNGGWKFGYGTSETTVASYSTNVKYKVELIDNAIYVDDVLKQTVSKTNLPNTQYGFALYTSNGAGNIDTQRNCKVKLYDFKVYYNDVLSYNFVPCYRKSDSVAGLYENINNIFYTNDGTGEFIVGGNI